MKHLSSNAQVATVFSLLLGLSTCTQAVTLPLPVEVTLGHHVYHFPMAYFDNTSVPYPRGPVELNLTAPEMIPFRPRAQSDQRTPLEQMLAQVPITIESPEGISVNAMLERKVVNDGHSVVGSLERRDPRERLELRVAQPEQMGLTRYAVDEKLMDAYAKDYRTRYGKTLTRSAAYEPDWFVATTPDGRLASVITCDPPIALQPALSGRSDPSVAAMDPGQLAGCIHYFIDPSRTLFIQMSYQRAWLKDWKQMEDGVRRLMARAEVK